MKYVKRIMASALATAIHALPASAEPRPPQYVVISFDGALDVSQWQRSRALARETGASFTYFLSCVYLLSPETRANYTAPGHKAGRSNVGFGYSREDVAARLRQIWTARMEGHDIASHGCGHFDGKDWTQADWGREFDEFSAILRDAWRINDIPFQPAGWDDFAERGIAGFRAPYLSASPTLYAALSEHGFLYDASGVSRSPAEPEEQGGVVRFSLPMIPEGPKARPVIAMDYNIYVRHSGGKEKPEEAQAFEDRAYQAFRAALDAELAGKGRPLQIGFHFTLMNDAAYWRALERFAREACRQEGIRCVSYREMALLRFPSHRGAIRGTLD